MPFLVKSLQNFEKSQEKSGKISQLDLWQPWVLIFKHSKPVVRLKLVNKRFGKLQPSGKVFCSQRAF